MSIRLLIMRVLQPLAGRYPGAFYHVARAVARVSFGTRRGLRRNLIRNMLPFTEGDVAQARKLGLKSFEHVCEYYVDLCSLPYRKMESFEAERLELVNPERLAALADAGPVVAISAHTGNAELAIQALTFRGRPFVALVEAQKPPAWSRYLLSIRSSQGGTFHETTFAGIRSCIEALHAGGLVGFMGDRDIQGNGLCVELSGRRVRLPRGPWEIARRTDALVYPMFSSRVRDDHFRVYVEEPFRVAKTGDEEADICQAIHRFSALLESHLGREPSQWAITENFWQVHSCG